jgi:hypothetical protein
MRADAALNNYAVRALVLHLHIDRVCRDCQLVFLHLFAAVCPRDSKYRYCDHYFSQRRDQILPYFGNLNLVVRAIQLCLLWTLV